MMPICDNNVHTNACACNNASQLLSCKKAKNLSQVVVYYATIPSGDYQLDLPIVERNEEILACTNEQTKREKYFAWKLLLGAIEQNYGKDAKFERQPTGKWFCDLCHFSISHSDGVVAIALANSSVGVDVQSIVLPNNDKVVERVFSQKEASEYQKIVDKEQKALYFTRVWTQKESIFKMLNQQQFLPSKPQNYNHFTAQNLINVNNKSFFVTVACDQNSDVKFVKTTV